MISVDDLYTQSDYCGALLTCVFLLFVHYQLENGCKCGGFRSRLQPHSGEGLRVLRTATVCILTALHAHILNLITSLTKYLKRSIIYYRVEISPDWPLSLTLRVQYHYHIKRRESLTMLSYAEFGTNAMLMHCKKLRRF